MRILKNKIALSSQTKDQSNLLQQNPQLGDTNTNESLDTNNLDLTTHVDHQEAKNTIVGTTFETNSIGIIAKSYCKQIMSFVTDDMAKPYLISLLNKEEIELNEFQDYISAVKESVEDINSFLILLLIKNTDSKKDISFKQVLKTMAEIFIKYFSINWIFSEKVVNKDSHLLFRFKMLRRIKNPELFICLKS